MGRKKLVIIGSLLVLLLAIIVLISVNNLSPKPASNSEASLSADKSLAGKAKPATGKPTPAASSATSAESNISAADAAALAKSPAANLSALPGSADGPKQIKVKAEDIPTAAIKLEVSATGFNPSEFRVKAGTAVSLAITATDSSPHIFIFPNSSMLALTTMVLSGETKILTFVSPKAGTYSFRDDLPNFQKNVGQMISE